MTGISAPLRELTKKDVAYAWGPEPYNGFNQVKQEITSVGVLRYLDPNVEIVIQNDVSQRHWELSF